MDIIQKRVNEHLELFEGPVECVTCSPDISMKPGRISRVIFWCHYIMLCVDGVGHNKLVSI